MKSYNLLFISDPKHGLWVLFRTASPAIYIVCANMQYLLSQFGLYHMSRVTKKRSWFTVMSKMTGDGFGISKEDKRAATRENRSSGFPTRSDTNRPVQSQKQARSLKFRI